MYITDTSDSNITNILTCTKTPFPVSKTQNEYLTILYNLKRGTVETVTSSLLMLAHFSSQTSTTRLTLTLISPQCLT